jgi:hypothetical protein
VWRRDSTIRIAAVTQAHSARADSNCILYFHEKVQEQKLMNSVSPVAEENRRQRRDALILHITYDSFSINDKQL